MLDFFQKYYLVLKVIHITAMVAWMAGLMYLPRLFAYHHRFLINTEGYKTFLIMEHRLLRIIILPSMILTILSGLLLAIILQNYHEGWFHIKIFIVALLTCYHGLLSRWAKLFSINAPPYNEKFFRYVNEIPFILFIVIVILVIFKPL